MTRNLVQFYTSFEGRATRRDFNLRFAMVYFFGYLIALLMDITFAGGDILAAQSAAYFSNFFFILSLVPTFAVTARRLHDINYSGWVQAGVYIASAVLVVLGARSVDLTALAMGEPANSLPGLLCFAAVFVILVAFFILLSLKRGTAGPNKYGSDRVHKEPGVEI